MRYVLFLATTLVVLTVSLPAQAKSGWPELLDELRANHPAVAAGERKISSLAALPDAKMAWDDPMIKVGVANLPTDGFAFDQEPMTQKVIGLTQKTPSRARRIADRDAALADTAIARAELAGLDARLAAELKKTAFRIAYVDQAFLVLQKSETIFDQFIRIANARYATGKGLQLSVIHAQVERSRLVDRRLALTEQREREAIRFNRLLGRNLVQKVVITSNLLSTPGEVSFDDIWPRALERSPALILARARKERAQRGVAQAEGTLGVNLTFAAQYGQRDEGPAGDWVDFVSASATATLPLWKSAKQDRLIKAAQFAKEQALFALADEENKLEEAIRQAIARFRKERAALELYRAGLVPQATQAFQSAIAAYQADRIDFLNMLTHQLTLLKYELEMEEARLRLRSLAADLEALEGRLTVTKDKVE